MHTAPISPPPIALTIAGSDSGGGAGIQADLKTFTLRQVFGCSAITAITAQNTLGVFDIHQIPPATITAQLAAIYDDFKVNACKIGMLGDVDTILTVADSLKRFDFGQIVLDPVMVAKGGAKLLADDATAALVEHLLPIAHVITPNLVEAAHLTQTSLDELDNDDAIKRAGDKLLEYGVKVAIIKGGHANNSQSDVCRDWIFSHEDTFSVSAPRFATVHTHGTGCTFSACLTAELAKGNPLKDAINTAKAFISAAISQPIAIGGGAGPVNHWAYRD